MTIKIQHAEDSVKRVAKLRQQLAMAEKKVRSDRILEMRRSIKELQVTPEELGFGTSAKVAQPKAAAKHYTVAPKYQDPNNPANTWSGRGKPAKWIAQTGLPLEKLLITQPAQPEGNHTHH